MHRSSVLLLVVIWHRHVFNIKEADIVIEIVMRSQTNFLHNQASLKNFTKSIYLKFRKVIKM